MHHQKYYQTYHQKIHKQKNNAYKPPKFAHLPDSEYSVYWYNVHQWSFGFAPISKVTLTVADTYAQQDSRRLSWHMLEWIGGWRAGTKTWLNSNTIFYKTIYWKKCNSVNILDDCEDDSDCTVDNTVCNNNNECVCDAGYIESNGFCVDINECLNPDVCGDNSYCINTDGSYICACNAGYKDFDLLNPGIICQDIDECLSDVDNNCALNGNAVCENTEGSFVCKCLSGFEGDATVGCTDIDECANDNDNNCATNNGAQCINQYGSYMCECLPGFIGNPNEECEDIRCITSCEG
eukprot:948369_1